MNSRYIIGIIVVLALAAGAYYFGYLQGGATQTVEKNDPTTGQQQDTQERTTVEQENILADVGYFCDGGKTVHAVYFEDKLIIELSDGRAAQLHSAGTAAGDYYTNADGSIAFANQGSAAFVEENGGITYANCVELDTSGVEVE